MTDLLAREEDKEKHLRGLKAQIIKSVDNCKSQEEIGSCIKDWSVVLND